MPRTCLCHDVIVRPAFNQCACLGSMVRTEILLAKRVLGGRKAMSLSVVDQGKSLLLFS